MSLNKTERAKKMMSDTQSVYDETVNKFYGYLPTRETNTSENSEM